MKSELRNGCSRSDSIVTQHFFFYRFDDEFTLTAQAIKVPTSQLQPSAVSHPSRSMAKQTPQGIVKSSSVGGQVCIYSTYTYNICSFIS